MIGRTFLGPLVSALLCAIPLGCREQPPPPVDPVTPVTQVGPTLTADQKVLLALDYYEPVYKVDANGRVAHLQLTRRHLPPSALAEVNKLTELRGLDAYGSTLTDEGLAELKNHSKIFSMGLGGTLITDQGLEYLATMPNLQWVWLPRPTVTKAAVDKLTGARPDMHVNLQ